MVNPEGKLSIKLEEMRIGQKYWIRYRIPGLHRVDRTMIAQFLGDVGKGIFSFSGRPQFGTTELDKKYFLVVREVAKHAECYADRKIR